jgi:pimeloyl-ACP methyl ester carboxylesterase
VAHDWGGVLAWPFAAQYPDLLSKLVILNAPHPAIFARELKNNPKQQKASEYTLLLRSPRAEEVLSRNNFEWLRKVVFEGCKDPGSFDEEDRAAYLKAWSQPGAISGGVNYYRASPMLEVLEDSDQETSDKTFKAIMINVPTLVVWGEKDTALTTDLLNGLENCVSDLQIRRIPDATHWVQHDAPDLVNQYIWDFLRD